MRRPRSAVVAAALLSAVFVVGCGDSQPAGGSNGDKLLQPTDTSQLKGMLGDQMKNAKIKEKTPL